MFICSRSRNAQHHGPLLQLRTVKSTHRQCDLHSVVASAGLAEGVALSCQRSDITIRYATLGAVLVWPGRRGISPSLSPGDKPNLLPPFDTRIITARSLTRGAIERISHVWENQAVVVDRRKKNGLEREYLKNNLQINIYLYIIVYRHRVLFQVH